MRVFLLSMLLFAATAVAEDAKELWRFRRGETVREVDVAGFDAATREVLVRRLEGAGFERIAEAAPTTPVGQDLEADIRRLVRSGGRFEGPTPGRPFLGARIAVSGEARGHVHGVREGSLAYAMGLRDGDRVLRLDGKEPGPARCALWADANALRGQRTLRLRRRDGRTENWTLLVALD